MNRLLETLPNKEAKDLKAVVKLFDNSRYDAALKNLKKLEKRHSKREEYQMFRNLLRICHNQEMEQTEYDPLLAESKKLLRKNLKKGFFWQMLGMIQKRRGHYDEASKTLTQALRFEKDNMVLYRDACNLLFHSRNLQAHCDKRKEMLMTKSSNYSYWGAYAMSLEMVGNYIEAEDIVKSLREMMMEEREIKEKDKKKLKEKEKKKEESKKDKQKQNDKDKKKEDDKPLYYMEYSEVTIYHAEILIKMGRPDEAIKILKKEINVNLTDKTKANELLIQACIKSRNLKALKKILKKEIKRSPYRIELIFLNAFIWLNSCDYKSKISPEIFALLESKKFFQAFKKLCADNLQDKKFIAAVRDYMVTATKFGRLEALEYFIIWLNYSLGEIENFEKEMSLMLRRNCVSVNPAFFRKMRILVDKSDNIDFALFDGKREIRSFEDLKNIPTGHNENKFFDREISEIIYVSRQVLKSNPNQNPLTQIANLLLDFLEDFNTTGSFKKISESVTTPTAFQTEIIKKYEKYFDREIDFTNAAFLLQNLALVLSKLRETGTAVYILNYLIKTSPGFDEAYFLRGKLLFKLGFWRQGLEDIEIFRRMNHQDRCETFMGLSALFKSGAFKKAERLYNYFIIIDGEIPFMERIKDLQKFELLITAARGYQAHGQLIRALRYVQIGLSCFDELKSNQFDFISYGLRAHSLMAVKGMRELADDVQDIQIYIRLLAKFLGLAQRIKNLQNWYHNSNQKNKKQIDKNDKKEEIQENNQAEDKENQKQWDGWAKLASGQDRKFRYLEELGFEKGQFEWKYEHKLNHENWDKERPEDPQEKNTTNNPKSDNSKEEKKELTREQLLAQRKRDYPCLTLEKHRARDGEKLENFQKKLSKLDLEGHKMISQIDLTQNSQKYALQALNAIKLNQNQTSQKEQNFYHLYSALTKAEKTKIKLISRSFKALLESNKVLPVIRAYHFLLQRDVSVLNYLRRIQFYDFVSQYLKKENRVPKNEDLYSESWESQFKPQTLELQQEIENRPKSIINSAISEFLALEPQLFATFQKTQTQNPLFQDKTIGNLLREYINQRDSPQFVSDKLPQLRNLIMSYRKDCWARNQVDPDKYLKVSDPGQLWLCKLASGGEIFKKRIVVKQLSCFVKTEFF